MAVDGTTRGESRLSIPPAEKVMGDELAVQRPPSPAMLDTTTTLVCAVDSLDRLTGPTCAGQMRQSRSASAAWRCWWPVFQSTVICRALRDVAVPLRRTDHPLWASRKPAAQAARPLPSNSARCEGFEPPTAISVLGLDVHRDIISVGSWA